MVGSPSFRGQNLEVHMFSMITALNCRLISKPVFKSVLSFKLELLYGRELKVIYLTILVELL